MNVHNVMLASLAAVFLGTGSTAGSQDRTSTTSATDAVRVSVIGCVQRTPATAADNTTTIIPEGGTRYVLSNVTLAGHDAVSGRDTRSDIIAEAVNQYQLDDASDSMIAPHVGDRVQVSGTVIPRPAGTSGRTASLTAASGPRLRVEHIEKVSEGPATCLP